MDEKELDGLLKDVVDERERVKDSVRAILALYELEERDVGVKRMILAPEEILVPAEEECNIQAAKRLMASNYLDRLPAPITLVEHRGKRTLFMGSNRGVVFMMKGKKIDCVIVKLPRRLDEPHVVAAATKTMRELVDSQID
jgi:hypothetical protein